MSNNNITVGVTGDTGWDLFTTYLKDHCPPLPEAQTWQTQETIYDLDVPAGAHLSGLALDTIFGGGESPNIQLCKFLPKNHQTLDFYSFPRSLVFLKEFGWSRGRNKKTANRIFRFSAFHQGKFRHQADNRKPLLSDDFSALTGTPSGIAPQNTDIVLVDDAGGTWRDFAKSAHPIEQFLGHRASGEGPFVIVNMHLLPQLDPKNKKRYASPFWNRIVEPDTAGHVCVICSATMLRQAGAHLSWRLSWEQTVEDLATELIHFDGLRELAKVGHLIIRFGTVGAVHLHRGSGTRSAHLVFAPLAADGVYRDRHENGQIIGHNTLIAAAIIKNLASQKAKIHHRDYRVDSINTALGTGLLAGMRVYDSGYQTLCDSNGNAELFVSDFFRPAIEVIAGKDSARVGPDQSLGIIEVPSDVIQRPVESPAGRRPIWQILSEQLDWRDRQGTTPVSSMATI